MADAAFKAAMRLNPPKRPGGTMDIGTPAEDMQACRLVKRITSGGDAGKCNYNDAGERPVGITAKATSPDDTDVTREFLTQVNLLSYEGLVYIEGVTADAVSLGDALYAADDGKVGITPTRCRIGYAMSTKTDDTDELVLVQLDVEEDPRFVFQDTVDSSEASANALTIDTGLGVDVIVVGVLVNGSPAEAGLAAVNGSSNGEVDVSATDLAENDVVTLEVIPAA